MKKKIAVTMLVLFVLMAATLPAMTQAYTVKDFSELVSKESASAKKANLIAEPAGAFEIPSDIKAKMSKGELYKLQAVPGYFKPQQVSVLGGQQMLLTDPQPVKAIVCVDEEMQSILAGMIEWPYPPEYLPWEYVYDWAWNILEGGDDYLESPFGIDIQMEIAVNWDTPDNLDIYGLLYEIDGVDPTGVGCDIIVLMTGQPSAWEPDGLAYLLGRHFVMKCYVGLPANLFQHEASHLFGPNDHGWNPLIYCIMSYTYTYSTRGYCSACTTNINEHKFRFD